VKNPNNHQAACVNTVTIRQSDFQGWPAVYLENNLVRLIAVPDIGGRIMAYDLGPYPYLFVDPNLAGKLFSPEENQGDGTLAAWKNYGGDKTWPAPQGWDDETQWHGPPDPVLDSGCFFLDSFGSDQESGYIRMVSPKDTRTGLQITRQARIYPESTRASLELTFTNISDRIIRWSIWDVVQLRADRELPGGKSTYEPDCTVTAPLNPTSRFQRGFNVMFGESDNPQWDVDLQKGLFVGKYLWEIGKVGIDSSGGWIAFSNNTNGYAFTERFDYHPGEEYPDEGASVECWTVGKGTVANLDYEQSGIYLMETEVLGPLNEFGPGESKSFNIEWGACKCPGPIMEVTEAGCVGQSLALHKDEAHFHISGLFGVFEPGELILRWLDQERGLLVSYIYEHVTPLKPVVLDKHCELPADAKNLVLSVRADYDGKIRELARLRI